jgi:thiamine-phosphate pyrophosphorylase
LRADFDRAGWLGIHWVKISNDAFISDVVFCSVINKMQLIVITPEKATVNEIEIVNQLFSNGLQRLHVRKPLFMVEEYRRYIERIDPQYYNRLVIHGCFELSEEFKLGGIHLNSSMRNDKVLLQSIKHISSSLVSSSFHGWAELLEQDLPYGYVFISPVFDSISKEGYKAGIDLKGAMETKHALASRQKVCPAIIGLGGVGAGQLKVLDDHGFDGAAMLGAIWQAGDPVSAFRDATAVISSL